MATKVDSTQSFEISGPGGGSKPSSSIDSTQRDVFGTPSPNDGPGDRGRHASDVVGKPETPGIINTVFYVPVPGAPASLDSTFDSVLDISFKK
jgi:hypothetical protein